MKIRALRRQRYFKKIYKQKNKWAEVLQTTGNTDQVAIPEHEQKAVRLTEDGMKYEALMMYNNFSEDEHNSVYMYKHKRKLSDKRQLL